jgi:hypothetical protein
MFGEFGLRARRAWSPAPRNSRSPRLLPPKAIRLGRHSVVLGYGAIGLASGLHVGLASTSALAVVDRVHGAVDRGSVVACQKRDGLCDIVRRHHSAGCGDAHDEVVVGVLGCREVGHLRRQHPTGTDRVDPQAFRAQLHRKGPGQPASSITDRQSAADVYPISAAAETPPCTKA